MNLLQRIACSQVNPQRARRAQKLIHDQRSREAGHGSSTLADKPWLKHLKFTALTTGKINPTAATPQPKEEHLLEQPGPE